MKVIPLQPVKNQFFSVVLNNQPCRLNLYQKTTGMFIDVYVGGQLIIGGVICQDLNRIVRDAYLGFVGDLVFYDTSNIGDDPDSSGFGSRFLLLYMFPSEITTPTVAQLATSVGAAAPKPKQSIHVIVPGTVSRNTAFSVSVSFSLTPPPVSQLQFLNPVLGVPGSSPQPVPATAGIGGNVISFPLANTVLGMHTLQIIDNSTSPPTLSDIAQYNVI